MTISHRMEARSLYTQVLSVFQHVQEKGEGLGTRLSACGFIDKLLHFVCPIKCQIFLLCLLPGQYFTSSICRDAGCHDQSLSNMKSSGLLIYLNKIGI